MNRLRRGLVAVGGLTIVALGAFYFAVPAMAANKGNFKLHISGTNTANTGYVYKTVSKQNGRVHISTTDGAGALNMWAEMYNSDGVPRSDAVLATYQKTTALTSNTGKAGYKYYMNAKRQFLWNDPETFTGWWSPDK